jgi:trichohyalin
VLFTRRDKMSGQNNKGDSLRTGSDLNSVAALDRYNSERTKKIIGNMLSEYADDDSKNYFDSPRKDDTLFDAEEYMEQVRKQADEFDRLKKVNRSDEIDVQNEDVKVKKSTPKKGFSLGAVFDTVKNILVDNDEDTYDEPEETEDDSLDFFVSGKQKSSENARSKTSESARPKISESVRSKTSENQKAEEAPRRKASSVSNFKAKTQAKKSSGLTKNAPDYMSEESKRTAEDLIKRIVGQSYDDEMDITEPDYIEPEEQIKPVEQSDDHLRATVSYKESVGKIREALDNSNKRLAEKKALMEEEKARREAELAEEVARLKEEEERYESEKAKQREIEREKMLAEERAKEEEECIAREKAEAEARRIAEEEEKRRKAEEEKARKEEEEKARKAEEERQKIAAQRLAEVARKAEEERLEKERLEREAEEARLAEEAAQAEKESAAESSVTSKADSDDEEEPVKEYKISRGKRAGKNERYAAVKTAQAQQNSQEEQPEEEKPNEKAENPVEKKEEEKPTVNQSKSKRQRRKKKSEATATETEQQASEVKKIKDSGEENMVRDTKAITDEIIAAATMDVNNVDENEVGEEESQHRRSNKKKAVKGKKPRVEDLDEDFFDDEDDEQSILPEVKKSQPKPEKKRTAKKTTKVAKKPDIEAIMAEDDEDDDDDIVKEQNVRVVRIPIRGILFTFVIIVFAVAMTGMGYLCNNYKTRLDDAQDEISELKSNENSAQYEKQIEELESKVTDLTEQNSYLTSQISLLQNSTGSNNEIQSDETSEQTSEGETSEDTTTGKNEKYIVQSGDSLYKIAQKVYGDGSRYSDILKANGMTEDNISLAVGDELIIPE